MVYTSASIFVTQNRLTTTLIALCFINAFLNIFTLSPVHLPPKTHSRLRKLFFKPYACQLFDSVHDEAFGPSPNLYKLSYVTVYLLSTIKDKFPELNSSICLFLTHLKHSNILLVFNFDFKLDCTYLDM